MAPQLILPTSARREAQQSPRPEVSVYVQVAVVFEGGQSDDAALVEVLKTLQRDNVLFMCAYLNTVVSGFGALDSKERQELALSTICRGDQRDKINIFAASRGAAGLPTVFFRGQMLELMRWAARYCERTPGGGRAFEDPDVLGRFFKGALIASDVWSRRVYGDKLAGDGNANDVRRRALGALRKGSEESNPASHPGVSMGRGRSLFTAYMPRADPHFPDAFRAATGLTIEDYLVAAAALLTYTFARRAEGTIFDSRTVAAATAFQQAMTRFVELESQRPDDFGGRIVA
jgi:hypothetical protein